MCEFSKSCIYFILCSYFLSRSDGFCFVFSPGAFHKYWQMFIKQYCYLMLLCITSWSHFLNSESECHISFDELFYKNEIALWDAYTYFNAQRVCCLSAAAVACMSYGGQVSVRHCCGLHAIRLSGVCLLRVGIKQEWTIPNWLSTRGLKESTF